MARRRTWTSYIVYRKAAALLQEAGVRVHRPYVGEYVTSLEMAGVSVTVIKLDDELKHLVDASADTPMFTQLYRSAGGDATPISASARHEISALHLRTRSAPPCRYNT